MKYLLDTNICIYIIKKRPINVLKHFQQQVSGSIGISTITLAELQYGVHKSKQVLKNERALQQFLSPLTIVNFDAKATLIYGKIRSSLEKKGKPIGALDMLIAAHAKSLDVILITNNEKEFRRVKGLKVENWVN